MSKNNPLIERFKDFYSELHSADLSQLQAIYDNDIVFKDPVHEIKRLVGLEDYFTELCRDVSECRFEYLDELVSETSAYITWIMYFRHPKLNNRLISVRGVSHLNFTDKVTFHEDVYDMGAMLYEHIPLLGRLIRWLRQRLAK